MIGLQRNLRGVREPAQVVTQSRETDDGDDGSARQQERPDVTREQFDDEKARADEGREE